MKKIMYIAILVVAGLTVYIVATPKVDGQVTTCQWPNHCSK